MGKAQAGWKDEHRQPRPPVPREEGGAEGCKLSGSIVQSCLCDKTSTTTLKVQRASVELNPWRSLEAGSPERA